MRYYLVTYRRFIVGIKVSIVQIRGDRVRLGIVAPKDIVIHRSEVWDAIEGKMRARKEGA